MDQQNTHIIKKIITINSIITFFVFLHNQIFLFLYNPYLKENFSGRFLSATFENFFIIIFLIITIPLSLLIGFYLLPVKNAITNPGLLDKAKKRIYRFPFLVLGIYLTGYLMGPFLAYFIIKDPNVILNDFLYVFLISFFSGLFAAFFMIFSADAVLFRIKKLYGMHILSDTEKKFFINLKLIFALLSTSLLVWGISQYIGWYYYKKGMETDTGDYFLNLVVNVMFIILLGIFSIVLIGNNLNKMIKYMKETVGEIIAGKGDLTKRINIITFDEIGLLVSDFNKLLNYLNSMIQRVGEVTDKVGTSKKLLYNSIEGNKNIFEAFIDSINNILTGIHHNFEQTKNLNEISTEIKENAHTIKELVDTQEQSVVSSSASIKQITENIHDVNNISTNVKNEISGLLKEVYEGKSSLEKSIKSINLLSDSSKNLLLFVQSISDISERIKLLAINASIEAARAGRSGEGFAVVANEVRKLSESSSNTVKNIESNISIMNERITESESLINSTGNILSSVFVKIENVTKVIEEITNIMLEQEVGTKTIEKSIANVLENNKSMIGQVHKDIEQSNELQQISSYFITSSQEIVKLAEKQREKNEDLIGINSDLSRAWDSMEASVSELNNIFSEFKIQKK